MKAPIRIVLLDDHPAVRAGFEAIVAAEPDLELVGAATGEAELWPLLRSAHPDVLLLDLHHPGRDGLSLCLEINRQPKAPAIVLYSASPDDAITVAAVLAGAGAVVSKASSTATLLEAIRAVARAPRTLPPVSLRMRREAAAKLDPADRPILAMRLAGYAPAEIGQTLGLPFSAIRQHITAIIAQLDPIGSTA